MPNPTRPQGLAYNEDFDHFLGHYSADDMNPAGLEAYVAKFSGTHIRRLFFCPNSQRANFRSNTREAIWDGNDPESLPPGAKRWLSNARLLHEKNIDLYAHYLAAARKHRISPWLSMRMNDVHFTEKPDHFIHNSFWKNHPQYWRVPGSVHAYADRSLDYGIEAVRDFNLAFVDELLNRYDLDGLELDWMRFVHHFAPGHEARGGKVLLGFWRRVRELADKAEKKHGHAIALSTRVPTRPETARGLGLDAVEWAREGLVNQITISPFFGSTDFDIPLQQWIELLGPAREKTVLAPSLEMRLCTTQWGTPRYIDPDAVRGFAASMFDRDADLVYLFNYHYLHDHNDGRTGPAWVREFVGNLSTAGAPASLAEKPRRHVVTFTDTAAPGVPRATLLPCELQFNRASQFRLDTGPKPAAGARVTLAVALGERAGVGEALAEARLNSAIGARLPDGELGVPAVGGEVDAASGLVAVPIPNAARVLLFTLDARDFERGCNLIEVYLRSESAQVIVWVELRISP